MKKKQIRPNVFETNSSSSHSISIAQNGNEEILDTIIPNEDGRIVLNGGEFGWGYEKYNDALTKANYCAVDVQHNDDKIEMLEEVLMEQTGAKEIIFEFSDNYKDPNWSYIDHESCGTSIDAFVTKDTLKDFIFNKRSWLFIGNDNDSAPPNFYDVDDSIVYTHQLSLVIEGECDSEIPVIKFQYVPTDDEITEELENILYRLRFNKSLNLWQYDSCYSSSGEEYFEYTSWGNLCGIDCDTKTITITNDKYGHKKRRGENVEFMTLKYEIIII